MKIDGLLHVNIRCSAKDLPAIEKFYDDALGMKSGYRPKFTYAGAWLYHGDNPLIHVNARYPEDSIAKHQKHTGSIDHIAFKCTGAAEVRERLVRNGITFQEQNVENAGYQIFVIDHASSETDRLLEEAEAGLVPGNR